jgi:preprotein translocase subunit SecD
MQRYQINLIILAVIVALALWIVYPDNPGIHVGSINREIATRLGLDLVGGVQALLEADLPAETEVTAEMMSTANRIVENRVNGLGVNEAVVQQAGDRRILVELPGETDPEQALSAIKETGLLEFVDFSSLTDAEIAALLEAGQPIQTDFGQSTSGISEPTATPTSTVGTSPGVFHTVMTGAALKTAQAVVSDLGEYQVAFELTADDADFFAQYTRENIGSVLAIVLDKEIISAPAIQSEIPDGQGVISGDFDSDSANALAIQLRYGALPIPLTVVSTRAVGPSLGQDSLQKSLIAGLIGFTIVFLFMAIYYRLPGIVAIIAILIYGLIAFALFRFIPVTLTLAGVAGFLLSTGSALDANILIFERFKEELRAGRNLSQATAIGWQRAWPSIRDSNIATMITCVILFWFGSAYGATIVKGFSLTLFVGVLISLFCALFVSRTLMETALNLFKPSNYAKWFGL